LARTKSREEKLFAAAVLRRSFELRGEEHGDVFKFVYEGVLRDLGLDDADVVAHMKANAAEVEAAIGRRGGSEKA
jgi:hypothetical protein